MQDCISRIHQTVCSRLKCLKCCFPCSCSVTVVIDSDKEVRKETVTTITNEMHGHDFRCATPPLTTKQDAAQQTDCCMDQHQPPLSGLADICIEEPKVPTDASSQVVADASSASDGEGSGSDGEGSGSDVDGDIVVVRV